MRATRGSEERTATLTKVEKAGRRKLHRRVERGEDEGEEPTSATKRGREETRASPGREKPGAMARLVEHYLSPCLLPSVLSFSFSPPPVKTRIFHSDVLATRRVTVAAVNEDAAIKCCCRTEITERQKGISAFTSARVSVGKYVSSLSFFYDALRRAVVVALLSST